MEAVLAFLILFFMPAALTALPVLSTTAAAPHYIKVYHFNVHQDLCLLTTSFSGATLHPVAPLLSEFIVISFSLNPGCLYHQKTVINWCFCAKATQRSY